MNLSVADLTNLKKIPLEWRIAFAGSIGLHIVLVITILLFTGVTYNSKKIPDVIDVDLTMLTAPKQVKQQGVTKKKVKAVKKKAKQKVRKAVKKKKTIIPSKKKKKIKKKVAKSRDIINDAIKRLKKDLDKSKPDPLAERMKQLRNEVNTNERTLVDERASGDQGGQNTLIARYISYVKVAVHENWAFSKNLAGGTKNLQASISFIVMPNGEIKGVKVEKKSGNSYMDSAASMAVVKASPVNPFPPGITDKYLPVIVTFKP